jgi:preprotein translocase subunit SecE
VKFHPRETEEGEVAERKRRGRDAIDEELDGVLDDAVDDDALSTPRQGLRRSGRTRRGSRQSAGSLGGVDETVVDEDLASDLDDVDLDDTDLDEDDVEADDSDLDEDLEEVPAGRRRGRAAKGPAARAARSRVDGKARTKVDSDQLGIFGRLLRFVREVVAELRKVIWPTRKELLTYTAVLVVFVTVIIAVVGSLDWAFAWVTLHVLGGK